MIDYQQTDEYLSKSLRFGENFDVIRRTVKINKKEGLLFYISSLISDAYVVALMESLDKIENVNAISQTIFNGNVKTKEEMDDLAYEIFSGTSVLIVKGVKKAFLIDVRSYPARAVGEPDTEKTIRGSRDGFVEALNTNVGLIRRRLKTDKLVIKNHILSEKSKITVALMYLDDIADKDVIQGIENKIKKIDVESMVMSDRALEELIFQQKYSPFPLVRYTERPDVAAINMMNGKILIMVDTSASAMMTPVTLIDHTKHVEEFRQSPLVGSFTRFLRTLAIIVSVLAVPLYMCLLRDSGFSNGVQFAMSSAELKTGILFQILIVELIFEIIRIASIHTPNHLTSAISLVAAIILGQVSMELGLFLPEILLMCALTAICGFATPSYELSMANKLVKIALIVIVAFFGRTGFIISLTALFLYLMSIKIWGIPYLYPLCPFDPNKAKLAIMRTSATEKKQL